MEKLKTYIHETQSMETIRHAFEIAQKAHEGQIRATGEPYIIHPLAVAYILASWKLMHKGLLQLFFMM